MGLADAAICGIADSLTFRASAAPYLLLDVFPDNPRTPEARGVQLLVRRAGGSRTVQDSRRALERMSRRIVSDRGT